MATLILVTCLPLVIISTKPFRPLRSSAVRQIDHLGQFLDLSGGKISIAHATLGSAKRSDQRNEKHRCAIMPRVEVSGIANLAQNSNKDFHQRPSESGSRPKNPFLRSTQYPYIHMRFPGKKGEGV